MYKGAKIFTKICPKLTILTKAADFGSFSQISQSPYIFWCLEKNLCLKCELNFLSFQPTGNYKTLDFVTVSKKSKLLMLQNQFVATGQLALDTSKKESLDIFDLNNQIFYCST